MTQRVFLTGAGGAAALAFHRAVTTASPDDVEVSMGDMDPLAQGLYLVPEARRHTLPAGASDSFARALLEACVDARADVVVPTVDVELHSVARAARAFRACGIQPVLASAGALRTCLDKARLMDAVPAHLVPRWAILDRAYDLRRTPLMLPLVAKPRSGAGGRGVRIVRDAAALAALPRDGSLLLQELLPGEEYSVDVLLTPTGRPVAAVPRERMKVDSGVAVVARTVRDPLLQHLACQAAKAVGLSWVVNVQFKRDVRGVPRLLEINPRFPGTMSLTVAAGVDMPSLALGMARGEPLPPLPSTGLLPFDEVGIVRTWQEHAVPAADLGRAVRLVRPARAVA